MEGCECLGKSGEWLRRRDGFSSAPLGSKDMKTYVYQAVLTPDEDGGYDVEFPSLPGCFACGDTIAEAAEQAVDAASTYVAVLVRDGLAVLEPEFIEPADGGLSMMVAFSTDEGYIVEGETVSAAGAARGLSVSPGRITHMLDSGILTGYRKGRRTYVTVESIAARLTDTPRSGRPKRGVVA